MTKYLPNLDPEGIDLLMKMLEYDPAKRVSVRICLLVCCSKQARRSFGARLTNYFSLQAKEALKHPYFADLDKETIDLLENPEVRQRDQS